MRYQSLAACRWWPASRHRSLSGGNAMLLFLLQGHRLPGCLQHHEYCARRASRSPGEEKVLLRPQPRTYRLRQHLALGARLILVHMAAPLMLPLQPCTQRPTSCALPLPTRLSWALRPRTAHLRGSRAPRRPPDRGSSAGRWQRQQRRQQHQQSQRGSSTSSTHCSSAGRGSAAAAGSGPAPAPAAGGGAPAQRPAVRSAAQRDTAAAIRGALGGSCWQCGRGREGAGATPLQELRVAVQAAAKHLSACAAADSGGCAAASRTAGTAAASRPCAG